MLFRGLLALASDKTAHRQRILRTMPARCHNGNRTHVHNLRTPFVYGVLENEPRSLDCRRLINSAVAPMDNDFDAGMAHRGILDP